MLNMIFLDSLSILSGMVQREPGFIVGPISSFLGFILDFIFNIVFIITEDYALGLSIILFTIIIKLLLLPLSIKSYKSMAKIQELQPEMQKINEKYGKSKDPEIQKKKSMEIQKLYSENKANPLGGCLPIFLQFPIFMSLFYIMNQPYLFITKLGEVYNSLAESIMSIPDYNIPIFDTHSLGLAKIPRNMELHLSQSQDLLRLLNKFDANDWEVYLQQLPSQYVLPINTILEQKNSIEQFMSISLVENAGLSWPSILIPIIAVVAAFLSSYITTKQNKSTDPNVAMQQKVMLYVMPGIMGVITIGMPVGVGLYWITSNIFQLGQQLVFIKLFKKDKNSNGNVIDSTAVEIEDKKSNKNIINSTAVEVKDKSK